MMMSAADPAFHSSCPATDAPAISMRGLSKSYRLGAIGRHTLVDECQYLWHRLRGRDPRAHMSKIGGRAAAPAVPAGGDGAFWALKDVSFDVQPGEVVGIIGRNGSGKSTLLKLLTRITEPTAGEAIIRGRVASLLEVGTGFHPELTGRENIFMNGTILGMKKAEIAAKFDEIVAFSEIEKFIDTPVKRYSSGMYVRLAFAVAAHLDPEILLVDEVLAVGDAAFQKKCLGKMGQVARTGRTVLFVSHNMPSVQALCQRAVVLCDGRVMCDAPVEDAIEKYLRSLEEEAFGDGYGSGRDRKTGQCIIQDVYVADPDGNRMATAMTGQPVQIAVHYRLVGPAIGLQFGLGVYSTGGEKILHLGTVYTEREPRTYPPKGCVVCAIPRLPLLPGRYLVNVSLRDERERIDHIPSACVLDVSAGDFWGTGKIPPSTDSKVVVDHTWVVKEEIGGRSVHEG